MAPYNFSIIPEELVIEYEEDDEFVDNLTSFSELKKLVPQILKVAQNEYDGWIQGEDDELNGGGICHFIADDIVSVLLENGIEAVTFSQSIGDVHVFVIAVVKEGIYEVNIPASVYERGGGYSWTKIEDVIFDASDLRINKISSDPHDFKEYLEDY